MSDYKPSTEELRDLWVDSKLAPLPRPVGIPLVPAVQAEFDLWIATIKADALTEAAIFIEDVYSFPDNLTEDELAEKRQAYWEFTSTSSAIRLHNRANELRR